VSLFCRESIPLISAQDWETQKMKILATIVIALLLGIRGVPAHEKHEHPPGPRLFGHPPEHIHVLLNPMPVYGLMIGILGLTAGLLARSRPAQVLALSIIVLAGASAWPTHYFGENGYQNARKISDEQGQRWLDEHMARAERFLFLFYGTALVGIATLVSQRKFPRAATPLTIVTLVAAIASASVGGWISRAGGHIRHSEFRHGLVAPSEAGPHQHGEGKASPETMRHDKMPMQPSDTHAGHQAGAKPEQVAENVPLPDTIEGVWKAIHEHHGGLDSAIKDKKFGDVQAHATKIGPLTKRLVELAHPAHKAAVETGVTKINQALEGVKQSAETGSESVMKDKFNEFEKGLNDLEQRMKRQ
jgi:hypothetical protein